MVRHDELQGAAPLYFIPVFIYTFIKVKSK
nr:MAG TPA: resistance to inhibitors of cholinesterase-like protein [Caudoviricetes sp.]